MGGEGRKRVRERGIRLRESRKKVRRRLRRIKKGGSGRKFGMKGGEENEEKELWRKERVKKAGKMGERECVRISVCVWGEERESERETEREAC